MPIGYPRRLFLHKTLTQTCTSYQVCFFCIASNTSARKKHLARSRTHSYVCCTDAPGITASTGEANITDSAMLITIRWSMLKRRQYRRQMGWAATKQEKRAQIEGDIVNTDRMSRSLAARPYTTRMASPVGVHHVPGTHNVTLLVVLRAPESTTTELTDNNFAAASCDRVRLFNYFYDYFLPLSAPLLSLSLCSALLCFVL